MYVQWDVVHSIFLAVPTFKFKLGNTRAGPSHVLVKKSLHLTSLAPMGSAIRVNDFRVVLF